MPARQRETQPAFFDGEASDQRNAARAIFKSVTVAALADIYAVHTRGYYAVTRPNEAEFLQLVTPMTGTVAAFADIYAVHTRGNPPQ